MRDLLARNLMASMPDRRTDLDLLYIIRRVERDGWVWPRYNEVGEVVKFREGVFSDEDVVYDYLDSRTRQELCELFQEFNLEPPPPEPDPSPEPPPEPPSVLDSTSYKLKVGGRTPHLTYTVIVDGVEWGVIEKRCVREACSHTGHPPVMKVRWFVRGEKFNTRKEALTEILKKGFTSPELSV